MPSDEGKQTLEKLWKGGRKGNLCALEALKAWALREVMRARGEDENLEVIASKVKKIGGGHPNRSAIFKLFERIDADPGWFPGKSYGLPAGRPPALSPQKQQNIAASAMAQKEAGLELRRKKVPRAGWRGRCV